MHIDNLTQQTVVIEKGRLANNAWTRLRGLIGVRHLDAGDGMLITPCKSVHCMFMSIPIDVIYVDKQDRVVATDANLRPWRIGRIARGVQYVVEVPTGTIASTKTAAGDSLRVRQD